jgi:hypothetical protein
VVEGRVSRLVLDGRSVIRGVTEAVSRVASIFVTDGVRPSDWTFVLGMLLVISVGCVRGSAVMEEALSSTELMTGS